MKLSNTAGAYISICSIADPEIEKEYEEVKARFDHLSQENGDLSKAITDLGESVSEDEKKEAEEKSDALKKALEGSDLEDIKTKKEELNTVAQALATKAYEAAQAAQQEQQDDSSSNGETQDDNIVDADFEEVD